MAASGSFVGVIIVPAAATATTSTSENSERRRCDSADIVEAEDWKEESCPLWQQMQQTQILPEILFHHLRMLEL